MDVPKSISFNHQISSSKKEKSDHLNKSSSFSADLEADNPLPRPPEKTFSSIEAVWNLTASEGNVRGVDDHRTSLEELSKEIDDLIDKLSSMEDSSDLPDIPRAVLTFSKMVQSVIENYDSQESTLRFGQDEDDDNTLISALSRISTLCNLFNKFSSNEKVGPSLSVTTLVIQRSMKYMEEEFQINLEDCVTPLQCNLDDAEGSNLPEGDDFKENNCIMFKEEAISKTKKIASLMISTGYEKECCQVYSVRRRNAFKEAIIQQGFEKMSIDEVQKKQWEVLEGHIANWIKGVRFATKILLPGEKKLCDNVFSDEHPSIGEAMFSSLARAAVTLFLSFAEAISVTTRTAERVFKILDVYDTLTELITTLDEMCSKDCSNELRAESSSVRRRLGEAAVYTFCDLENSMKNDVVKSQVPGGAVCPSTRYTMNYLRYACDFKDTLEKVFSLYHGNEINFEALELWKEHHNENDHGNKNQGPKRTPFTAEILTIMKLLDQNLEAKSRLYKDPSLRCIFLMNNGRYILQKIKESTEFHDLLGTDYRRKRSSDLRGYHKNYQRETWSRVLQCLNQEGLQVNGKVQKKLVKERFKTFNQMFDEIYKTQSHWVVSDEQLQSELQVSISAVMIPAYRSFLARFGQHLSSGRQYEKYIKYQPEDIEKTIEGLFDGNQNMSMPKRKN